jgi:hypothetical protein
MTMSDYDREKKKVNTEPSGRNFGQDVEMAADRVSRIAQQALKEGNSRRLTIRTKEGQILVDTSLTIGAAAGGLLAFFSIPLTIIVTVVALITQLKFEISHEDSTPSRITVNKRDTSREFVDDEEEEKPRRRTRIQIDDEE